MLTTNIRTTKGLPLNRVDWVAVFGFVLMFGLGSTGLRAEMIDAVEKTGSSQLRGMIDSSGSVFDRLLSWTEFSTVNIVLGTHDSPVALDAVAADEKSESPMFEHLTFVGPGQGSASNSLDSSSSSSGNSPVHAAILSLRSSFPDPVLLQYWRGREFVHVPDAPSSGLFRPPRQHSSI